MRSVVVSCPTGGSTAGERGSTFDVRANGGATSYQWFRNGTAISGATLRSYTTPLTTQADGGSTFHVRVSNAVGSVDSRRALLTVTTNRMPVARIDTPAVGRSFAPGETITYSGAGADPEALARAVAAEGADPDDDGLVAATLVALEALLG